MNALLEPWERWCARSGVLRFVDISLRGIAQVMFQDNPLTGAFFLAAVAWGSYVGAVPEVALAGLLGLVTATLTAKWLRVDAPGLAAGLYGYNGVLVGLALATFLVPSTLLWCYVMLGAAVSVVAMLGTANVLRGWHVSALTFPFVITTWLLLLATYAFAGIDGGALPFGGQIVPLDAALTDPLSPAMFFGGVLKSISQVFLKGDGVSAALFVAGLAVSSVPAALLALGGAALAVITAHLLGAESALVSEGLLGFSPVLTAIALGTVFHRPGPRVLAYTALGTVFTVVVQGAMNVALTPLGIPALTAPFVLTAWLFLLPRRHFGSEDAN